MQTWFINSVPLLAVALRSSCGLSSASSGTLGSFVISHCVGDNSLTYQINCLKGTVRLTKASSCELSQLEHFSVNTAFADTFCNSAIKRRY